MAQLKAHNDFLPPPTQGRRRSLLLALIVHALLVLALAYAVPWHLENTDTPPFTAELWATLPLEEAPPAPEVPIAPPAAPTPVETVVKPPSPAAQVAPPTAMPAPAADADIVLSDRQAAKKKQEEREKAIQEKKALEKEQEERRLAEKQKADALAEEARRQVKSKPTKAQEEKQVKDLELAKAEEEKRQKDLEAAKAEQDKRRKELEALKVEQDKRRKELEALKTEDDKRRKELEAAKAEDDKRRKELELAKLQDQQRQKEAEAAKKVEAARLREEDAKSEKLRTDAIQRMNRQMPTTSSGNATASGTAAQNAGPSASYGARVVAAIRPHIEIVKELSPSLRAEYAVYTDASGRVTTPKLLKSSGDAYWDEVALKAILKTERLPIDDNGRVPSPMTIVLRPRD